MTFTYNNVTNVINLGTITKFSNTVQKRVAVTPIVSLNMQSAFPIESGNSQSYSISFTHYNGQNGETNEEWYRKVTTLIDRWQARTNGCLLNYTPSSDNPYHGDIIKNMGGYVKSISRTFNSEYNEIITGTLEFCVGTMYVNEDLEMKGMGAEEPYEKMSILISDSAQTNWYAILYGGNTGSDKYNCIDSVTISGGVEEPFETATIIIPKKKLMEQIPALYGDIVDGQNRLLINCMGKHNMYVDQVKISKQNINIRGITYAQWYQQRSVQADVTSTPYAHIMQFLTDARNGVSYSAENIITNFDSNSDPDGLNTENITFKTGTKIWRALQVCATMLRCRIFFADNKAYLLDYTKKIEDEDTCWVDSVDLYGSNEFRGRVVGEGNMDEDGSAPVKNTVTVVTTDDNGNTVSNEYSDALSVARYDIQSKGTIQVPELNKSVGEQFAMNHLRYIREPQRTVTFTLKEMYGQSGQPNKVWKSYFGASAQTRTIIDRDSSDMVLNTSYLNSQPAYNKLILSSYKRQFPKGVCEYTFGTVANIDLANNVSQTANTLNTL